MFTQSAVICGDY